MTRVILTLTLTLSIFLTLSLHSFAEDNQLIINVNDTNITEDEIISVGVKVNNIKDIYGIDMTLKYNNQYLEPLDNGFDLNPSLDSNKYFIAINTIDKEKGLIRFMATSLGENNFDIDDNILNIRFKTNKTGKTTLSFDKALLLKKDITNIQFNYVDKEVNIVNKSNENSSDSSSKSQNSSSDRSDNNISKYNDIYIETIKATINGEYVDNITVKEIDIHKYEVSPLIPVSNVIYLARNDDIVSNLDNNNILDIIIKYKEIPEIEEEKLAVYWLNEDENRWIYIEEGIDRDSNTINIKLKPLTKFAIFQSPYIIDFNDMDKHWSNDYVKPLLAMGIINGYEDHSFRPNSNITRGEFSKIIIEALNISSNEINNNETFSDSNDMPLWAKNYIALANENNIISGYEDGTVKPNNIMTRSEMSTALSKILPKSQIETDFKFDDQDEIPDWALDGIRICIENGILNGYDDNTIRPNAYVTRGETCKMVYMLLKKIEKY